ILNVSVARFERCPPAAIATTLSVYAPGRSVLVREIWPAKRSLLVPVWAASVIFPALGVRLHRGRCRLTFVWATHRPPTLRPSAVLEKLRLTLAGALTVNEKVVPTGRRLAAPWGCPPGSRQRRADCRTLVSAGGLSAPTG